MSYKWQWTTLGDIAQITSGGTPSRSRPEYWNGNIPWATTSLINFCKIKSCTEHITKVGLQNSSAKIFPAGSLLVALYGQGVTRGKSAILGIDAATNQACAAIIPKKSVNAEFLFYYLQSQYLNLRKTSQGGNQKNLSGSLLKSYPVPLLSLEIQSEIIEMLKRWDKAISILEELIADKNHFKKGLMQQFLSGKQRFPEFNDSWIKIKLKDVAERVIRKNDVNNTNVLTISAQLGLVNQQEYYNKRIASKDLSNYYLVKNGEFAYNKSYSTGYPYGAIKRLDFYDAGVTSSLYICFKVNNPECDKDFFAHFFEAGMLNHGIYRIAQEGARNHGLLNISVHDFFDIELTIPGLQEQQKIATTLNTVNKELQILNQKLDALKEQKKGLMQQLLTGKKRVKVKDVA